MNRLIAAFPGTGKSYATQELLKRGIPSVDSDSSQFAKDDTWPASYIQHIQNRLDEGFVVFCSTHKEVRDALLNAGMSFTMVLPDPTLCDFYMQRYHNRGSSEAFISLMYNKWHEFIDDCLGQALQNPDRIKLITLNSGLEFISDLQFGEHT